MPPLSLSWLQGHAYDLTPAQRVVRVLQVTRANWQVSQEGRRHRRHGRKHAALLRGEHHGNE
jgi:hypothetical protein